MDLSRETVVILRREQLVDLLCEMAGDLLRILSMSVSHAKRLKELETENGRFKRLLADALLENEVTKEALRKKW